MENLGHVDSMLCAPAVLVFSWLSVGPAAGVAWGGEGHDQPPTALGWGGGRSPGSSPGPWFLRPPCLCLFPPLCFFSLFLLGLERRQGCCRTPGLGLGRGCPDSDAAASPGAAQPRLGVRRALPFSSSRHPPLPDSPEHLPAFGPREERARTGWDHGSARAECRREPSPTSSRFQAAGRETPPPAS